MKNRLAALVIGNAKYPHANALRNPVNDAEDVTERLEGFGFSVTKAVDCSHRQMDIALKEFKANLANAEVGLFFFAGHGLQIDGVNYLTAVNTDMSSEIEAKHTSLCLNLVIDTMEKSPTSTSLIILDACRNNPLARAWSRSVNLPDLATVFAPRGTLIAFSTSPGQTASDGNGCNGAYTGALLQHIDTPDCTIESMLKRVRNTLSATTKGKQISWEHTSLSGEYYFNRSVGARIDEYSQTALCDISLVLDEARASHRLIRELKTYTWPRQDPAVNGFTPAEAGKFNTDSLFVIGRNIYQSACGGSKNAARYIGRFIDSTQGLGEGKRKALLDGMLFEIFFDSNGQLRKNSKVQLFNNVFDLQKYSKLSSSFDFIAECLSTYAGRFHVMPGKSSAVSVDVTLKAQVAEKPAIVEGVYFESVNLLRFEDEECDGDGGDAIHYGSLKLSHFEQMLSEQLVVPRRLLHISYPSTPIAPVGVRLPLGWTVSKPHVGAQRGRGSLKGCSS